MREVAALSLFLASCATSAARFPWPAQGPVLSAVRADVTTVNPAYQRASSQVLVRKISRPTRANLDYAAYHANFMNADPPPEGSLADDGGKRPHAAHPFAGALDSLAGSLSGTPLSAEERAHALALPPLVELLTSKRVPGADRLEDITARIRAENWGLPGGPQMVRQTAAEAFLHDPGKGQASEIWIKVELAPWFKGFAAPSDEDGDGFPEIYGRAVPDAIGSTQEIVRFIRAEYEGRVFTPAEVKAWAHQLASYWYPSYNTDLVPATGKWPANDTEAAIRQELGDLRFEAPAVVMRGKPLGKPVYNVFLVEGAAGEKIEAREPAATAPGFHLSPSVPSPDPVPVMKAVQAELAAHGGSWNSWNSQLTPFQAALKARLAAMPAGSKAVAGSDGFLFFRQSMAYVLGGDLDAQRVGRNPIPVIVEFKELLAKQGVDFLFVPIPTKVEIFPEKTAVGASAAKLARFGGKVVNPFERKLLLDLADRGVETLDLMPAFLAERAGDARTREPLYQAQDTHWTARGLELAARLLAERIRSYPWYQELVPQRRVYQTKDESFTRHGDLHSRLPEAERAPFAPETLVGHQVTEPDGTLYEDVPESPVVVLGDSFTGVYELMDCEHAGVSAHVAKEIGIPVDLVMSYGGGPTVREKFLRRGMDVLKSKKLVIWMMTARDLHDYAEGWLPVENK